MENNEIESKLYKWDNLGLDNIDKEKDEYIIEKWDHLGWTEEQYNNWVMSDLVEPVEGLVDIIYVSGYYDMPLSGMARYNGYWCWFKIKKDEDYHWRMPVYKLYKLPPEVFLKALEDHALFEEHVGRHWNYKRDGNGYSRVKDTTVKNKDKWHEYYDHPHYSVPDVTVFECLGEFVFPYPTKD